MSAISRSELFPTLLLLLLALAVLLSRVIFMAKGTFQPKRSTALSWLACGGLGLVSSAIIVSQNTFWLPTFLGSLILLGMGTFEWKRCRDMAQ